MCPGMKSAPMHYAKNITHPICSVARRILPPERNAETAAAIHQVRLMSQRGTRQSSNVASQELTGSKA